MDELVQEIVERTGIPQAQAEQAVTIVVNFLKKKLPDPIAAQVDNVLAGIDGDQVDDLLKGLGGLLGRK